MTSNEFWYQKLIAPRAKSLDGQRRELILNILLAGLTLFSFLSIFIGVANDLEDDVPLSQAGSVLSLTIFLAATIAIWRLSRLGLYKLCINTLLGLIFMIASNYLFTRSFELPATQLLFATFIAVAGVLLESRSALRVTGVTCLYLLLISYLQVHDLIHPNMKWLRQRLLMIDGFGLVASLALIGLISWLANREISKSLERARLSEAALAVERDQLERKVIERTRQLERAQLQRVMELQRLAEFGRLSAGLLHDVADPLTVASLNLQELGSESQSTLLKRALQSVQYIERFLAAARKQLESRGDLGLFTLNAEVKQVLSTLQHRASGASVKVVVTASNRCRLYGDPVKFNQIVANLVLNAIEAYNNFSAAERIVKISLRQLKSGVNLEVSDHGKGMTAEQIEHIFEPFYTTKPRDQSNMGIGLSTVKKSVEVDFRGQIQVVSSPNKGTCFNVLLRDHKK